MAMTTLSASAQERMPDYGKNEITVSYGGPSTMNVISLFGIIITLGQAELDTLYTGGISVGYLHYVHPYIGVGAMATYEYGYTPAERKTQSSHHYINVMPQAKFYWFNHKHIGMYSRIGAGAMYVHGAIDGERHSYLSWTYQLSAICLEAGGKVRGFLELGSGCMGMIVAGVKVNF